MRRFVSFAPALVVLVTVLSVLALAPAAMRQLELARMTASVQFAQARLDANNPIDALNQATRDVADAVMPGVVHIQVRAAARTRVVGDGDEGENDDAPTRPQRSAPRASAAGWFWSQEGFIVTNAHVVEDADILRVELFDGRVRTARVIGTDIRTDIAVLKIDDVTGLNPPRRASGEPLFVGDRVFAFGSPFGIKFSMSQGIVSGLGRSEAASLVNMTSGYTNFIQTDAAMNPGNSGGPLVDARGRVIGMSTAIANNMQYNFDSPSPQGQSAGIGFAIPLETIEAVVTQLLDSSVVIRGYLGITLQPLSQARENGLVFDGAGIIVTEVRANNPADRAGLRVGDIITAVNGVTAVNPDVLRSIVSIRKPGEAVKISMWRDGQASELDVRIGAAYFTETRGSVDLRYVEGSESMTWDEVRSRVKSDTASRVD